MFLQQPISKNGMELYQKQKEAVRRQKIEDQRQVKEMLEKYWPWGKAEDAKPRGLRNLRLEELFPIKDYNNSKRFVGSTIDLGRPGGGAPIISSGTRVTRTKEDPLLRFQFGSKDLRRCVDNTLRYKKNKEEQEKYRKELDRLVEEKRNQRKLQKEVDQYLEREQGWSNEKTLQKLETEIERSNDQNQKTYENFERMKIIPPNKIVKLDPLENSLKRQFIPVGKNKRLSPLSQSKDNGVELVTLLAKERKSPPRVPLCSTDVTSDKNKNNLWDRSGSAYLRELTRQMVLKQEKIREIKAAERESVRTHFSTWDGFWGRPGNGAPKSALKKQRLDRLLYPQMVPIGVH